jgi:hypothetical protein
MKISMNTETTICVEIIEGSEEPVFAEVPVLHLGKRFYKITEHGRKDFDTLRFNTGDCVFCLSSKFNNEEGLIPVAYCKISEEAVLYILGLDKL